MYHPTFEINIPEVKPKEIAFEDVLPNVQLIDRFLGEIENEFELFSTNLKNCVRNYEGRAHRQVKAFKMSLNTVRDMVNDFIGISKRANPEKNDEISHMDIEEEVSESPTVRHLKRRHLPARFSKSKRTKVCYVYPTTQEQFGEDSSSSEEEEEGEENSDFSSGDEDSEYSPNQEDSASESESNDSDENN